jgi:hypothetical protein
MPSAQRRGTVVCSGTERTEIRVQTNLKPPSDQTDRRLWEGLTTAFRAQNGIATNAAAGSNARTEAARSVAEAGVRSSQRPAFPVDLYIDPVCPYTWLAACWLRLVEKHRDIDLQYHPMSLRMLNEQRTVDQEYRANLEISTGPSRIGTAVWLHHGPDAFRAWHTTFGSTIFDYWRYPTSEEYRTAAARALHANGLPAGLVHAADTDEYDEPLRRSHLEGTLPVGVDSGTPVIHLAGAAYFGPVLNAVSTIDEALDLFDGFALLAGCRNFFELKRTRTSPPVYAGSTLDVCDTSNRGDGA